MSKAQAVYASVRQELERRRSLIDGTDDLYAVRITVKFEPGSSRVKGLSWEEERSSFRGGASVLPPKGV